MRGDKLPARLGEQAAQGCDRAFVPVEETQHL